MIYICAGMSKNNLRYKTAAPWRHALCFLHLSSIEVPAPSKSKIADQMSLDHPFGMNMEEIRYTCRALRSKSEKRNAILLGHHGVAKIVDVRGSKAALPVVAGVDLDVDVVLVHENTDGDGTVGWTGEVV